MNIQFCKRKYLVKNILSTLNGVQQWVNGSRKIYRPAHIGAIMNQAGKNMMSQNIQEQKFVISTPIE